MTITQDPTTQPLNQLLDRADDLGLRGGSVEDLAETAVAMAHAIKLLQARLEPLKELIRDFARADRQPGDHHVPYEVPNGRVCITFPDSRYEALKDVDWNEVRKVLGPDFDKYFLTVTTVRTRPNINELLIAEMERAQDSNAEEVLRYVELDEPTARVGFKPDFS